MLLREMFCVFTLWLNYNWKMIKFKNLDLDRGLMITLLGTVSYTMWCELSLQSCPTLCDPMDCSPPGSSIHRNLSQEYWSGLPFPPPEDLPDPGIKLASSALPGGFFTIVHQGSPVTL